LKEKKTMGFFSSLRLIKGISGDSGNISYNYLPQFNDIIKASLTTSTGINIIKKIYCKHLSALYLRTISLINK